MAKSKLFFRPMVASNGDSLTGQLVVYKGNKKPESKLVLVSLGWEAHSKTWYWDGVHVFDLNPTVSEMIEIVNHIEGMLKDHNFKQFINICDKLRWP